MDYDSLAILLVEHCRLRPLSSTTFEYLTTFIASATDRRFTQCAHFTHTEVLRLMISTIAIKFRVDEFHARFAAQVLKKPLVIEAQRIDLFLRKMLDTKLSCY